MDRLHGEWMDVTFGGDYISEFLANSQEISLACFLLRCFCSETNSPLTSLCQCLGFASDQGKGRKVHCTADHLGFASDQGKGPKA